MRLLLESTKEKIELSHFTYLLSAYELCPEEHQSLRNDVIDALDLAKETGESQYIEHDVIDFVLAAHPGGAVTIYSTFKHFDSVTKE